MITVAGQGESQGSKDGSATESRFNRPSGMIWLGTPSTNGHNLSHSGEVVTHSLISSDLLVGQLLVVDRDNYEVRKIDLGADQV